MNWVVEPETATASLGHGSKGQLPRDRAGLENCPQTADCSLVRLVVADIRVDDRLPLRELRPYLDRDHAKPLATAAGKWNQATVEKALWARSGNQGFPVVANSKANKLGFCFSWETVTCHGQGADSDGDYRDQINSLKDESGQLRPVFSVNLASARETRPGVLIKQPAVFRSRQVDIQQCHGPISCQLNGT